MPSLPRIFSNKVDGNRRQGSPYYHTFHLLDEWSPTFYYVLDMNEASVIQALAYEWW